MKIITVLLIFCFCALTLNAQQERFDIATYTAPSGWTKVKSSNDVVGYAITNNSNGSYCQMAIYRSMESMGSAQVDFDTDWNDIIIKPYRITSKPDTGTPKSEDGWEVRTGIAPYDFNGGKSMAILVTLSGYSKRLSISIVTNTQDYQEDVDKFLQSVVLSKSIVSPQSSQAPNANGRSQQSEPSRQVVTGSDNSNPSIIGSWGKSNSVSQVNNRFGTYSYVKYQYKFYSNGTYNFIGKNYGEQYNETLLIKENGRYLIIETELVISPESSVIETWSKKNGADNWNQLKSSQKRALEKTTYRFALEGGSLVLQTDQETVRDGRFSRQNFYSYGPPETFTSIKLPGE